MELMDLRARSIDLVGRVRCLPAHSRAIARVSLKCLELEAKKEQCNQHTDLRELSFLMLGTEMEELLRQMEHLHTLFPTFNTI